MGSHGSSDPVDQPDDWMDGSWTVDCVCGVNFDDGEEMVDCDECGVWVHTRCSRYVKGEKVFECHKCKGRKGGREGRGRGRGRGRGGEKENEVAEMLVEMPNKSLRRSGENVGFRRRIWTPREERVHVQGVPGGEDGVFGGSGLSGVFGAGLWKASGYVPKKFGFRYKEYDWSGGNESGGGGGDGEGVCLLKDKPGVDGDSMSYGAGKRTKAEEIKKKKGEEGEDSGVRSTRQIGMKKDMSSVIYSGKRKKEGSQIFNDVSRKKKARAVHVERENFNNEQLDVIDLDYQKDKGGCVNRSDWIRTEHLGEKKIIAAGVKDSQIDYGSNGNVSRGCSEQGEAQVHINDSVGVSHVQFPPYDKKLDGVRPRSIPRKLNNFEKRTVAADCQIDYAVAPSKPIIFRTDGQLDGLDNSRLVKESSLEFEEVRHTREPSESCEAIISSGQLTKDRMVVSLGKSSSTPATTSLSRTKYSDSYKTFDAQNYNCRTQQNVVSEHKASSKKDSSAGGSVKDRERYEGSMRFAKELPKSLASSVITFNRSKIPGSSDSSKTLSESMESIRISSAKSSLLHNISSNPMSSESASFLQPELASHIGSTTTGSGLMQRSETVNNSNCQPSSKVDHTLQRPQSGAPNTPATISDEKLALLLHHELNSSSRVPRVQRMRHAGSLPQLASPTGANMLMKQSPSSSAGKDHGPVFKRKEKSIAEEGSQNSQELANEYKRSPLLPLQRTNDSGRTADSGTMRNVSSSFKSAQNDSDDDTGSEIRVTRRTLPGLVSEILTKRMTYKELCDAVLPHWPYLRKKNGERYAYSSHLQAVLDCLRSRREWARLVDRGPKSNAGRKRRRVNAKSPSFESGGNGSNKKYTDGVDCRSVLESCQDQFPKGKRNMRRRRRRLERFKNDESSSFSSSSSGEVSMFSDDGTMRWEDGTSSAGGRSEVSASE